MFFGSIGQTRQLVAYGLSSSVNWNAHQTLKVWMMMQFTHDNIHIQWIGLPFNGVGSKLYSSNSTLNGMKEFVLAFSKMCDSLITFYHYMHVSCRYCFKENMQDTWKTSDLRIHRRPYFYYRRLITHMALLELNKQTNKQTSTTCESVLSWMHLQDLGGLFLANSEDFPMKPCDNFTVCYWKWPFIVRFPSRNGDFW